ncbi:neuropilin and tolloid-like protein 1 [Ptychodera flava]|uniref:neuropilin and tolloid-like protein 1 n=1 Tax=Ptychodera flava TaxID=63121 RepID=UPI003969EB97
MVLTSFVYLELLFLSLALTHLCGIDSGRGMVDASEAVIVQQNQVRRSISCGGYSTRPMGVVTSPNYPAAYDNNVNCTYHIEAPPEYQIKLLFMSFDLENQLDFLYVYDDPDKYDDATAYTGSTLPNDFTSSSGNLYLTFETDSGGANDGFYATYIAYDGEWRLMRGEEMTVVVCNGDSMVQALGGEFVSHTNVYSQDWDGEPNECWSTFLPRDKFTDVIIRFTDVDVNNENHNDCSSGDFVKVSNEDVSYLVCGYDLVTFELTLPVRIYLNFTSSMQSGMYSRFRGSYTLFYTPPAGGHCDSYEFECTDRSRCIRNSSMCDGASDCIDGSDEHGCGTSTVIIMLAVVGAMIPATVILIILCYCSKHPSATAPSADTKSVSLTTEDAQAAQTLPSTSGTHQQKTPIDDEEPRLSDLPPLCILFVDQPVIPVIQRMGYMSTVSHCLLSLPPIVSDRGYSQTPGQHGQTEHCHFQHEGQEDETESSTLDDLETVPPPATYVPPDKHKPMDERRPLTTCLCVKVSV